MARKGASPVPVATNTRRRPDGGAVNRPSGNSTVTGSPASAGATNLDPAPPVRVLTSRRSRQSRIATME
ncbi:MAG: hypothetical protein Q4E05_12205 [Pseudoclavibacter sp.]|nr:hypothetical protein [Pseudoclavibacter sp.]